MTLESEREIGFTEATINIVEIWTEARKSFPDPEKLISFMDNFFNVCALRVSGLPLEDAEKMLMK